MAQAAESIDRIGLSAAEAARRLAEAGPNTVAEAQVAPGWRILLRQFRSPLVLLLIGAALVAAAFGEHVDAAAIGLVVVLNGALGFVQEWQAENALAALRNMLSRTVRVMRDGRMVEIDSREVVPGDLMLVEAGDRIAADAALVAGTALQVDESVLTGESVPVAKAARGADEEGRLFMGTVAVKGRGEAVVTATGARTAFGRIADLTGAVVDRQTTLSRQLSRLATQLGGAALAVGAAVAVIGLVNGRAALEMVMTGLSIAVAIVPEGLPAVVTISLALGAAAMARKKALARNLQAMETLGAASVICTDKTGTLTENAMTAVVLWIGGRRYEASGSGHDPAGRITREGTALRHGEDPALDAALDVAAGCTHAVLRREDGAWTMLGDPTEGALMVLAYKGWTPLSETPPLAETPFSSERKCMSMVRHLDDGTWLLAKGATERILARSARWLGPDGPAALDDTARAAIAAAEAELARGGLRVIALARRPAPALDTPEEALEFVGLAGLIDPPRAEIRDAIAACRSAGVRVVMITGDSPVTAEAIAAEIGLPAGRAITGNALDAMDDAALAAALREPVLFARTAPENKLRIVRALQAGGQVVGMTGDGVNDAPALKQADIGIAMGIRGTEVAKDASDVVLLDDNFATIVAGIREGRRQFANIRRFVLYLLASNAGEVIAILINVALGGPLIYLPTQILWMNLVTDGVTALTLGLEKATPEQMAEPPRRVSTGILTLPGLGVILAFGTYTAAASLLLFHMLLPEGETLARTAAFTGMVLFEKASVFAFRSLHQPNWRIGLASNPMLLLALVAMIGAQLLAVYWPPLQALLRTTALAPGHWLAIAALCLPLIVVPEAIKTLRLRRP